MHIYVPASSETTSVPFIARISDADRETVPYIHTWRHIIWRENLGNIRKLILIHFKSDTIELQ